MIDERNDERTRLPERERKKPFILFYFLILFCDDMYSSRTEKTPVRP
jgi:hypothetical protein